MSSNLRGAVVKKISQVLKNDKPAKSNIVSRKLKLELKKSTRKFLFALPLRSKYHDIRNDVPNLLKNESDDFLEHVGINQENPEELHFELRKDDYIKGVIESLRHKINPPDFMCETPKTILVDFSSPNIAKPFHVGHLRSTMIGNYISNVNSFFKNDVKRINYLGDWGTQYGFVQLGLSLLKVPEEDIKKDPINVLYKAYVYANEQAEKDSRIADQAREIFKTLEHGDKNTLSSWESFRKYTLEELSRTYSRMGIQFDEYQWESMYGIKEISDIVSEIERLNLISTDSENRKVIQLRENKTVSIVKSDGSSLYITRDIAAAIDRFKKYNFNTMYYVVDKAQTDHFINLISILSAMKFPWADRLEHIKFGKIKGMSTRKGTAVFLQDILDETRDVMKKKQLLSETTKVDVNSDDYSTDILSISAVIINDLRHKRHQDYQFSWDEALNLKGDTGITLQYTHCRLVNLEKNSGATIASKCIPALLTEPAAEKLVYTIGKFDEAVIMSYEELEPYILVHYLFRLSHAINQALKVLRVKGGDESLAGQRLLLMHTARKVLAQGMKLLGLTPLDRM